MYRRLGVVVVDFVIVPWAIIVVDITAVVCYRRRVSLGVWVVTVVAKKKGI